MKLIRYEKAKQALQAYKTVDEVKDFRDKAIAVEAYARQAKDRQLENDAAECRFRAERRLGEQLTEMAETGERQKHSRPKKGGSDPPLTLGEMGIDKDLAKAARSAASIPDEKFEEILETHRDNQQKVTAATVKAMAKGAHVANNSGEHEWYTPPPFIEAARKTMGSIDCDPASSVKAQKIVQAGEFFTAKQNGLNKDWCGNIWLNPPYQSGLVDQFLKKLVEQLEEMNTEQAITLTNNATETNWFMDAAQYATGLCLVSKRIRFLGPNGEEGAPLQGQAILYFGKRYRTFAKKFSEFGLMWVPA